MPAPSRAQRRRANMQKQVSGSQQVSPQASQKPPLDDPAFTGETLPLSTPSTVEAAPTSLPNYGTRPARQSRQMRQPVNRPAPVAPAPIDYTEDYRHARRDLLRIFIWSALLFSAMIAIRLTGIL